MDKTVHSRLQFNECAVIGYPNYLAANTIADLVLFRGQIPRMRLELLEAERDLSGLRCNLYDLYFDRIADGQNVRRLFDAVPGHLTNVKKPVDTTDVDEGTEVHQAP